MVLPKKYAKMGFKKGWREYRKSKQKRKTTRSKPMAKTRRRTRRIKSKVRRAKSKSMKLFGIDLIDDAILPGAYGAARVPIARAVTPLAAQMPGAQIFGNNIDEAGIIAAATLTSKFLGGKVPLLRKFCRNAIRIEFAQIGQDIALGRTGMNNNNGGLF